MPNTTFSQTSGVTTIPLWKQQIPNSQTSNSVEKTDKSNNILWITNVQQPSIDVYLPTKRNANGAGVLICPGGGYAGLAYDWEGTDMAKWLNAKGIAAFVLKYRLPGDASVKTNYLAPLQDAQRAMKIIKNHTKEWNLQEGKIGVMGFSAGGHLASTLGTHFDEKTYTATDVIDTVSARPDFMILIYPVISMKEGVTHQGSKDNLLGKQPSDDLVQHFSNELQINKTTPPTFIVHANDDGAVPVQNSLLMYEALMKNNIPVALHLFPKGGHGFSFGFETLGLSEWTTLCYNWILAL